MICHLPLTGASKIEIPPYNRRFKSMSDTPQGSMVHKQECRLSGIF
jgi:hypothetical protein